MPTSSLTDMPITMSSLEDKMRKTGTMNNEQKAIRLEEIVMEAAQETRI